MTLHGMVVNKANPVYDFQWLCRMMQQRKRVHLHTNSGRVVDGLINGIQPEDGSGKNWLVTVCNDLTNATVFLKAS